MATVTATPTSSASAPTLVKVISILHYIAGGIALILGILFIAGSSFVGTLLAEAVSTGAEGIGPASIVVGPMLIVLGVFIIIAAAIDVLLGWGLWKLKKWARIIVIVFACCGVLGGIISVIGNPLMGAFNIIISGLIGGYLIFSKEVKTAFA
jgi:hypothetical protein